MTMMVIITVTTATATVMNTCRIMMIAEALKMDARLPIDTVT